MIIDASALLLLVLAQPGHPLDPMRFQKALDAVILREGLRAPALLSFEVGNAVHRKHLQTLGRNTRDRAMIVADLMRPVQEVPSEEGFRAESGGQSEAQKLSFYDASYLALAAMRNETLLTADRQMSAAATEAGVPTYLLPADLAKLEADFPVPAPG